MVNYIGHAYLSDPEAAACAWRSLGDLQPCAAGLHALSVASAAQKGEPTLEDVSLNPATG